VLALEPSSVDRIVDAFRDGFFIQAESVRKALESPNQFNALDGQSALKVDFWVLRDDPYECCAFRRRMQVTIFGTPAWIAMAEDVILHKLYWNKLTPSDRQLQDAAGVYAVQAGALDQAYLARWASSLQVEQELSDLATGKVTPKST
jgi:hypothetical protein